MLFPEGWDPSVAVAAFPIIEWEDHVWRMHGQQYEATNHGGSLKVSGRYHRGLNYFLEDQAFPALYLSTRAEIALAELYRHVEPTQMPSLNKYCLSKLYVCLAEVLDCRDTSLWGLPFNALVHDTDYRATQEVGAAAFAAGFEGILAISATNLGDNLILFPPHLRSNSQITLVESRKPRLYVERS